MQAADGDYRLSERQVKSNTTDKTIIFTVELMWENG